MIEALEHRRLLTSGASALTGEYFTSTSTANLTGFVKDESDGASNPFMVAASPAAWTFNWASSAPATGVPAKTFSVRWEGEFTAPVSGTYTFYVDVDNNSNGGMGGDQLWVNGSPIISSTTSTTAHSGEDLRHDRFEPGRGQRLQHQVRILQLHGAGLYAVAMGVGHFPRQGTGAGE